MPSRSITDRRRLKRLGAPASASLPWWLHWGVCPAAPGCCGAGVDREPGNARGGHLYPFDECRQPGTEPAGPPAGLEHGAGQRPVSGYLKNWQVDIGTAVKAGQPLAEIDSPELDQQLAQAKARLAQHQASAALAQSTAVRWQHLLASHSVSRQEVDEKVAAAAVASADAQAAEADYARLKDLAAYKVIRAPFTGTITARHAQVGQLIKADSESATSLFDIADTRRLRLYVPVPQNYASQILPGMQVQLSVPERPGQHFMAALLGTSTAVDQGSARCLRSTQWITAARR